MDETQNIEENNQKDFEGNYLENFQGVQEEEFFPRELISWELHANHLILYAENTVLEVKIISPSIFKFRFANDGYFEDDFSYAIDPDFKSQACLWEFLEEDELIKVITAKLILSIHKKDFTIHIRDHEGRLVLEDEKGYHWKNENKYGGNVVISTLKSTEEDQYYGLGDKTGHLNLKGTKRELWGTDCYGYGHETDPVYKNIPFFYGLRNNVGYGVFLDSSFRTFFDFGHERQEVLSFWAQGGELRYYFIYGPELKEVIKQFAQLTGTHQMPPKWALGYHQSKWSYYPEKVVKELGKKFRDLKIPCDVIHLDIDYMDAYRCFTWDYKRFPQPKKMIEELKNDGFKTVVIIDPGIKIDRYYKVYQQAMHHNYFCTRMDGAKFVGSVWPGPCHFPDFTKPEVRMWWGTLFKELHDEGVAGVWNDMNEPAVFETGTFPRDVRHDYDGHPCSHRKGHNVYGMQMVRATQQGLQRFAGQDRVFTITRSAFAGTQRFSSAWTGDNSATWEHLHIANIQCQRLAASGMSFVGSDVGGFIGSPSGELYTRWIQMAVFHPFFRTHSSGDHGDKEPWVFEQKYLDIVRRFIEFRYELLPFIYTVFWQHHSQGVPMLNSLHLVDQHDKETYFREEEFVFGEHILVCPVSIEKAQSRRMYLPKGDWYYFWDDKKYTGRKEIEIETPLHELPLFVRAGAVIPMQPKMQYVDEFQFDTLSLHLYYAKGNYLSHLYEDDGKTLYYQDGEFCLKEFEFNNDEKITLTQSISGHYKANYHHYEIFFHAFPNLNEVLVDGEKKDIILNAKNNWSIKVKADFHQIVFN